MVWWEKGRDEGRRLPMEVLFTTGGKEEGSTGWVVEWEEEENGIGVEALARGAGVEEDRLAAVWLLAALGVVTGKGVALKPEGSPPLPLPPSPLVVEGA